MPVTCRDCFLVPKNPTKLSRPVAYLINSKDPMGIVIFCLFAPFVSALLPFPCTSPLSLSLSLSLTSPSLPVWLVLLSNRLPVESIDNRLPLLLLALLGIPLVVVLE